MCNLAYDTFLEPLGQWQYLGSILAHFGHHQDDLEAQECPPSGHFGG